MIEKKQRQKTRKKEEARAAYNSKIAAAAAEAAKSRALGGESQAARTEGASSRGPDIPTGSQQEGTPGPGAARGGHVRVLDNLNAASLYPNLPANYPNDDYMMGKDYSEHNIEVILGDNEQITQRIYNGKEEEEEINEYDFKKNTL